MRVLKDCVLNLLLGVTLAVIVGAGARSSSRTTVRRRRIARRTTVDPSANAWSIRRGARQ
jgi:hypothetical protein